MGKTEIIPRTIREFDIYISNTNSRQLQTNPRTGNPYWKDYNWTSAQSLAYKAKHDRWVNEVHNNWMNEATRTDAAKKEVPRFIRSHIDFVKENSLIEKIKSCDIVSTDDALTWQFVLKRKKPSHKTERINKDIAVMADSKGQGIIGCKVRVSKSEGRAKIPRDAGADCVQYAWAAFNKGEEAPPDIDSAFYRKDISTKADFEFDAGQENITKFIVIHCRWYNTKHPHLAGVWSVARTFALG